MTQDQLTEAQSIAPVVTVQNLYNLANRQSEEVVSHCEQQRIGFIPWFPLAAGSLAKPGGLLDSVAKKLNGKGNVIQVLFEPNSSRE